MVHQRQAAFSKISYVLAVTRLDIQQHQYISDYSLNIHSENYWRDVFNFIYERNYENANFYSENAPCIDLIDKNSKRAIQITTTRSKEKIEKTLKIFKDEYYSDYTVEIYYLLDKAGPSAGTEEYFKDNYGVDISGILFDYTDIVKDINNLGSERLFKLCDIYFSPYEKKYTDIKVLDLTIRDLVERHSEIKPSFDEDYQSLEIENKIKLNELNKRVSSKLVDSLDYTCLIDEVAEGQVIDGLRTLVVNNFYKKVLVRALSKVCRRSLALDHSEKELTLMARDLEVDFNDVLIDLYNMIDSKVVVKDFNSANVAWVIVAYFFEYCEAGFKDAAP